MPTDITHFDALVISDYQYHKNTQITLNWQVNEKPYQQTLNQTKHSINHIDFQAKEMSEISNFHLMITNLPELGLRNSFQDEVSFRSIRLDQTKNLNQISTNLSEWNHFSPLKLSALNGYTSRSKLHLKGLVLRLGGWLMVATLLLWILKIKGTHLILTISLAWFIGCYFFLSTRIKQHDQINQAYSAEQKSINILDQKSKNLASLITAKLKSSSGLYTNADKLVLIGANTFFIVRLKYHLLKFDIGLNFDIQNLLDNQVRKDTLYLLTENQLDFCKGEPEKNRLIEQVNLIHVDKDFCLLRKK